MGSGLHQVRLARIVLQRIYRELAWVGAPIISKYFPGEDLGVVSPRGGGTFVHRRFKQPENTLRFLELALLKAKTDEIEVLSRLTPS